MQTSNAPAKMTEAASAQSEVESPAPRVYDCTSCRYVEVHGLVCGACLRKILDEQAAHREAFLIAACFNGRGLTPQLRTR